MHSYGQQKGTMTGETINCAARIGVVGPGLKQELKEYDRMNQWKGLWHW